MAQFQYQALTAGGRLMSGVLEAASNEQAGQILREMNLQVQDLLEVKPGKPKSTIGRNEFYLFNQQLASLAKAGLPLEKGLRELAADLHSPAMRKRIEAVAAELEAGVPIEQAFAKYARDFPELYGRILEAGVRTGRLSEMLFSLNRHLDLSIQTRRTLVETLTYPFVVLTLAGTLITVFLLILTPQFEVLYADFDIDLPAVTHGIVFLGRYILAIWLGIGLFAAALIFLWRFIRISEPGRKFLERLSMAVPLLGRIVRLDRLSRLADTMGLAIGAGFDIPQSLRLGAQVTGSPILNSECEAIAAQIEQGASVAEASQFGYLVPRLFGYAIQMGVQRNSLQDNLYQLADMYSQQIRYCQGRLSAVLMPLMAMFVGGFIALGISALYMPISIFLRGVG